MKQRFKPFILIFLSLSILSGCGLLLKKTKSHSPAVITTYENKDFKLTINYCSPSKKGRLIFGEASEKALQPYGVYWRVGANEATWIEFNKDISFGGKTVKAGKYALYAYPGKDQWDIVLGSKWKVWGYNEQSKKNEVTRVSITPNNDAAFLESLLVKINEVGNLVIHWDKVEVIVPIDIL
jgi:hypothetical protein